MIRAIIIDDENASRDTLKGLLSRYCKNTEVIAEADGFNSALSLLKEITPDVVFLDIQMPDGSGFKLLEALGNISFEVVFTTAYDQYAIKAFKYSAIDYLLKPIDPDDLINAIEKIEKKNPANKAESSAGINVLLNNMKNSESKKIVLSTSKGMHVIDVVNIIRCESEDYYTKFFLSDGMIIMVSHTLKDYEELLADFNFIRPHKSHLVNMKYVKAYLRVDGGSMELTDGTVIPVSRRKRDSIIDMINHL
ncbi:MAG: LytTR family DNA-binding domain-containing protein [Bacteroidota bacterium]